MSVISVAQCLDQERAQLSRFETGPSSRIPADFEVLDGSFAQVGGDDWWDHHFDGGRWTEGPLYVPAGRYLLFSDIPNNRILRWDEPSGLVSIFDHTANYANGRTLDRGGRIITCEQGTRRVTRVEHDGSTRVLVTSAVLGSIAPTM